MDKQTIDKIRDLHGAAKVRVSRDGTVHGYGSADPYDKSKEYWYFLGYVEEIIAQLNNQN